MRPKLVFLRWHDVELQTGRVHVRRAKAGIDAVRTSQMAQELVPMLFQGIKAAREWGSRQRLETSVERLHQALRPCRIHLYFEAAGFTVEASVQLGVGALFVQIAQWYALRRWARPSLPQGLKS